MNILKKFPRPKSSVTIYTLNGQYEIIQENGFIKVYFNDEEIFDSKEKIEKKK